MKMKKHFGQNFLYDDFLLQDIVDFSGINKTDFLLEIGPGSGNLTYHLLNNCKKLIAIEIDKDLIPTLNNRFSDNANFHLINDDFLNMDENLLLSEFEKLGFDKNQNVKVVSNLPYYITSPIIMKLLNIDFISEITLLVQKEVADRICAKPNSKNFGVLTLAINFYADTVEGFLIPRTFFKPVPQVDSKTVKIIKHPVIYDKNFEEKLFYIIKNSFLHRRKTLVNSLSSAGVDKEKILSILNSLNISANARPENLSLDEYVQFTKLFYC